MSDKNAGDSARRELESARDWERRRRKLIALARDIVGERSEAEDLVQDALLALFERRPRDLRSTDRWLASALRLRFLEVTRSEAVRSHRELAAASEDSSGAPSTDLPADAGIERILARVREPYRSTLRSRYAEGLDPAAIAARDGVSIRTVHSRLHRGLARLREAWGIPRSRRPAFLVLPIRWPTLRRRWRFGAVGIGFGLGRLALALGAWSTRPGDATRGPSALEPPDEPRTAARANATRSQRTELAVDPGTVAEAATIRGRVVDPNGSAIRGSTVRFEPGAYRPEPGTGLSRFVAAGPAPATTTSGPDGSFEIALAPRSRGRLCAEGPDHAPVVTVSVDPNDAHDREVRLVVAPKRKIAGRVVRGWNTGVSRASVVQRVADAGRWLARDASRRSVVVEPWCRTLSDGSFAIDGGFDVPGSTLEIHVHALPAHSMPLEPDSSRLTIRLPDRDTLRVHGRVLADREPISDVLVHVGEGTTMTTADGSFEAFVARSDDPVPVWAAYPGYQPDSESWDPLADRHTPIELQLDQELLAIEGRVRRSGTSPEGLIVYAADPTPAGPTPASLFYESYVYRSGPVPYHVRTDPGGAFSLPNLLSRSYRIAVVDPRTLQKSISEPIRAGSTGVELDLTDEPVRRFHGRCLSPTGRARPDVEVTARRVSLSIPFPHGGRFATSLAGPSVRSDSDGRFALDLPEAADVLVGFAGPGLVPRRLTLAEIGSAPNVVLAAEAFVRVAVRSPGLAVDECAFVDEAGLELPIRCPDDDRPGALHRSRTRFPVAAGRSETVAAPETAANVVLFRDGAEIGRVPAQLEPGRETELEL